MKMVISALLALALTSKSMFAADGEVVKVFTQEFSKPAVEAKLGDLLVFSVQGGSFPGGMVQDLKVEVKGDSLSKVGVWLVPVVTPDGQRAVGGIDMSAFLKTAKVGEANESGKSHLLSAVAKACLLDEQSGLEEVGLKQFEVNVGIVCGKLRQMIDSAERRFQRDSMQKCVRLAVNNFQKSHHRGASRADVERCLGRLENECGGFTQEAVSARENINQFRENLMSEVAEARHPVDISVWSDRFKQFQQCPWKKATAKKS